MQDLGRPGYAASGISVGGAADCLAFRIGNRLVGNDEGAPALELTVGGAVFTFDADAVVAITGGECGDAPAWTPFVVNAGRRLRLGPARGGARMYLCVRGGLDAPRLLGSAAFDSSSGAGSLASAREAFAIGTLARCEPVWSGLSWRPVLDGILRATPGLQADWFAPSFWGERFTVSPDSDRRGIRLHGAPVPKCKHCEMLTEGVVAGDVQVPDSGEPIILFVDQQTTGGYPKIASVISADLWKLGQFRPGERVRFLEVSFDEALAQLHKQEQQIEAVR